MNRRNIIVAIVLLLVLMPAAVYADEELSDDVVASEATETTEDVTEPEDESEPADIQAESEDISEEEAEAIINDEPASDPDEDDWSDVSAWPDTEPPASLPDEDDEIEPLVIPDYSAAAARVKAAVAVRREFVDVSDLNLDDEDCLFDAFFDEGSIDESVDEISIAWESDTITAVLLYYEEEDEDVPVETVSTYQSSNAVMDAVEIEEADTEEPVLSAVKTEEAPDDPAEEGLSTWLALMIGAAAGILKMLMGGAL